MEQMVHEIAWLLEMRVNPGELETVRALMEEMVASARAEAGTLGYAWYVSEDGTTVALFERYVDSAAVLTHLATFGKKFAQRFDSAMSPARLTIFDTPSDEVRQGMSAFAPTYLGYFGGFMAR